MTAMAYIDPQFAALPFRIKWMLTLNCPARAFVKLRALIHGMSDLDIYREQTEIRFKQYGGEGMSERNWTWFINEMPTDEFIAMMLLGPVEEDHDDSH